MKLYIARMMLMAIVMVSLAAYGFAQSQVAANIPFEFTVADKTMPAGNYLITCDPSQEVVNIQSRENSGRHTLRLTNLIDDQTEIGSLKLVFTQGGGRYFLSQVWSGDRVGYQLIPGRAETEHAKSGSGIRVAIAAK